MKLRFGLAIVLLTFVAIFSVQNAEVVEVRLLFWTISMSRALLLFFAVVLGALLCWLSGAIRHMGRPPQ
jgi:uncharacterized integral membrane protein